MNLSDLNLLEHMTDDLPNESDIDMSGGTPSDIVEEPNVYYKQTLEYINNSKEQVYIDYLKEFESFFRDSKIKSNLSKYIYSVSNTELIKTSIKTKEMVLKITLPRYEFIDRILHQLNIDISAIEYKLKDMRDSITKKGSHYKKFDTLRDTYIELLEKRQIFKTFYYEVNERDYESKKLLLLDKRRKLKQDLYKLKFAMMSTRHKDELSKLAKEYVTLNTLSSIDKEIREIDSRSNIEIIIIDKPVISRLDTKKKKLKIVK